MDKMAELLKVLAEKVGTNVEKLGPHLVRLTQAKAWVEIGVCCGLLVLFWSLALLVPRYLDKSGLCSGDDLKAARLGAVLIGAFMSIICVCLIADSLPAVIEPIGATLKALVGA